MKTRRRATFDSEQSPAKQLAGFIARFDPAIARLVRSARSVLHQRFPTAVELVYDNYNALVIGYGPTEKASDALFSLAVYARGINLYFIHGRSLPDPHKLLQGSGKQGAFIRLEDVSVLDRLAVKDLLNAAVCHGNPTLPPRARGYTVIKSVSAKQRPRRLTT